MGTPNLDRAKLLTAFELVLSCVVIFLWLQGAFLIAAVGYAAAKVRSWDINYTPLTDNLNSIAPAILILAPVLLWIFYVTPKEATPRVLGILATPVVAALSALFWATVVAVFQGLGALSMPSIVVVGICVVSALILGTRSRNGSEPY